MDEMLQDYLAEKISVKSPVESLDERLVEHPSERKDKKCVRKLGAVFREMTAILAQLRISTKVPGLAL